MTFNLAAEAAQDVAVTEARLTAAYELRPEPWIARAWRFARTCVHAARLLPTVRRAIPWYAQVIIAVACVVKCLPVDFGADETLFAVAFGLIAWRRPGLLRALYREAQAGRPVRCSCEGCSA